MTDAPSTPQLPANDLGRFQMETPKIDKPGAYDAIPEEDYHGDLCAGPSLSSSGAVRLMKGCPAKFWHDSYMNPDREPPEPSKEMDFGKALHIATLEPDTFRDRVVIVPHDDYRTKEARDIRDKARAGNLVPILKDQAAQISALTTALSRHSIGGTAFRNGKAEQTIVARDARTGIFKKARPDWRPDHGNWLIDYKTVVSAQPRAFEKHAFDMGYHQQGAWYLDVVGEVTGKRPETYWFVAQERDPPFLVSVFKLAGDALEWGHRLNQKAIEIFAECSATGIWPGYREPEQPDQDRAFLIGLPSYAAYQLQDREEAGEFKLRHKAKPSQKMLDRSRAMQAPDGEAA